MHFYITINLENRHVDGNALIEGMNQLSDQSNVNKILSLLVCRKQNESFYATLKRLFSEYGHVDGNALIEAMNQLSDQSNVNKILFFLVCRKLNESFHAALKALFSLLRVPPSDTNGKNSGVLSRF